jgi:acetolactate synthase small subunit
LQLKKQLIDEIKERVLRIRDSLGLNKAEFDIVDVEMDDKTLTIYTKNRTDKSSIIGPGGWVVGRLREEMKDRFEVIRVEDYTDKVLFEKRVEIIKSLFDDEAIQDIGICSANFEFYDKLGYAGFYG